jgi:hypothetical protein
MSLLRGDRGVTASIRGREPRGTGSNPVGRPSPCGRRAPASSAVCKAAAPRCGGSTPPVRTVGASARRTQSHRFAFLLGERGRASLIDAYVAGRRRQSRHRRRALPGWDRSTVLRVCGVEGSQQPPGDEALTAEHLACTEEERVRLPPSPLHFLPLWCQRQHAPFVRL